jgi:diacylglycerol kinase (ATP)
LSAPQHIGLFVNPTAGRGKALRLARALAEQLAAKGIPFSSFTDWPAVFPALTDAWIVGGDGTLNYFINRYPDVQVPLAVFKGGTGNDFAWKLYGNGTLDAQLKRVLAAAPRPVDAGCCNGKWYLNSVGIGFDGVILKSMKTVRILGGHLGYLLIVVQKICSFREHHFTIKAGKAVWEGRYLLVAINNSSRTGGGFMVSPKADVTDGLLDLVLCQKLPVLKRLRALPLIEKGKHLSLPFVQYEQHATVSVSCGKEVFAQLDGDLISGRTFELRVEKGKWLFRY